MQRHEPRPLESLKYYRDAVEHLREFSREAQHRFKEAHGAGDLVAAREAFSTLVARTEEFKRLRQTLSPREIFIAKYAVKVHGPHDVSFTIPRGETRFAMVHEAHDVTDKRFCLVSLLDPIVRAKDSAFTAEVATRKRVRIQRFVASEDAIVREEQLLHQKKLSIPTHDDMAAAFAAHYVVTQEPLFKWNEPYHSSWSYVMRAKDGSLVFTRGIGLWSVQVADELHATDSTGIEVSARIE